MGHPFDNKKFLENLYLVQRLSFREIAKKTKFCRAAVKRYIGKHNIPQRSHRESISDQYTPFRFYLRGMSKAKYRTKALRRRLLPTKGKHIDLPYLKQVWEKQRGICPYTAIKLKLFTHSKAKYGGAGMKSDIRYASLDRIESSKP